MRILLLVSIIFTIFLLTTRRRQNAIEHWRKALKLNKHYTVYQKLYSNVDGFSLSQTARLGRDAIEFTYGEIDFESFIALLSLCKPNPSTIFYDLGSGTGKAVLACAMVFDVQKSCGVELFPALHHSALLQQQHLKTVPGYQEKAHCIQFIEGNLLSVKLKEASLIFINATTFFGSFWDAISKKMEQVKSGTVVITTSKALRSRQFTTTQKTQVKMSWGIVSAFIQQRL